MSIEVIVSQSDWEASEGYEPRTKETFTVKNAEGKISKEDLEKLVSADQSKHYPFCGADSEGMCIIKSIEIHGDNLVIAGEAGTASYGSGSSSAWKETHPLDTK